jgi:hypothetical protein
VGIEEEIILLSWIEVDIEVFLTVSEGVFGYYRLAVQIDGNNVLILATMIPDTDTYVRCIYSEFPDI